jgi:hypothetical protein
LQNAVLADAVCQFFQGILPKHLPGLAGIGTNGFGGKKNYPPGFHIGFQSLTLHSLFSLGNVGAIILLPQPLEKPRSRASGREFSSTASRFSLQRFCVYAKMG